MGKIVGRQFWHYTVDQFFEENSVHPGPVIRAPPSKAAKKVEKKPAVKAGRSATKSATPSKTAKKKPAVQKKPARSK